MAWRILVAVGLIAASVLAFAVVACSSSATCRPGTLSLDVALVATAPLADTLTVTINDPAAMVMQSFPHTPNPTAPGIAHTTVVVDFPGGYPANSVIHVIVRALGGVTILGAGTATLHLDQSCTSGSGLVSGASQPLDMSPTD